MGSLYAKNGAGLSDAQIFGFIDEIVSGAAKPGKILLLPSDYTRLHSYSGRITARLYKKLIAAGREVDVMPALGTHEPMTEAEAEDFFGGDVPFGKLTVHNWRNDVVKLGAVPGGFVSEVSEGLMTDPIDVEVNRRITDPSYGLIISAGQVVPHEVVGMANHNKNIFVGCGGSSMINGSHMVGAFYGLERMMGASDTPVRKIFNYAEDKFLAGVNILYILTVTTASGPEVRVHGVFAGSGRDIFDDAVTLSREKNMTFVEKPIKKAVVYLDGREFKSTWVGNKAVYRTRMAMAEGGGLIVVAPGVSKFGEDAGNDALIRKYGYVGRENILRLYRDNADLRGNKSAPAHLIHGSPDGKFTVTYAVGKLTREEIESVGYAYAPYAETIKKYPVAELREGFSTLPDGEEIYFIKNPALGLWVSKGSFGP